MLKRNKLSAAVLAAMTSAALPQLALAQEAESAENDNIELIQVRGIRASMARAMDVKRESPDVVDAISAEDISKFPDTNLAESLQRITGVSIDRSGGEGQLITVRGFGPAFNTVLINGRQMLTLCCAEAGR